MLLYQNKTFDVLCMHLRGLPLERCRRTIDTRWLIMRKWVTRKEILMCSDQPVGWMAGLLVGWLVGWFRKFIEMLISPKRSCNYFVIIIWRQADNELLLWKQNVRYLMTIATIGLVINYYSSGYDYIFVCLRFVSFVFGQWLAFERGKSEKKLTTS